MNKIDYKNTKKYWNNLKSYGQYSMGYHMDNEDLAKYRYTKELNILKSHSEFHGNYLDLGCGTGNLLYDFHKSFKNLIGVDFSALLIKCARTKCKYVKNIKLFNDNIINFSKYTQNIKGLDYIFIGGVLAYLEFDDIEKILNESWQYLNDGGYLVLREPTSSNKSIFEKLDGYFVYRRVLSEYVSLVSSFKYKNIFIKTNYYTTYVSVIMKYQNIFPFLKNIPVMFWENKLVELLFLYLPTVLMKFLRSNMYTYHFIFIKK